MKVTYIQHCGNDLTIVNAARVSFKKESDWVYCCGSEEYSYCGDLCEAEGFECPTLSTKDTKLINYLATHNHTSPFNHTYITMHIKAPIFVARQLVKHKFMPFNEVSRRYVTDEPEFYHPDRWRKAAPNVKQGSSNETLELINKKFKKDVGTPSQRRNPAVIKFARLRWRAQAGNIPFDLDIEDVEWNEVCPLLGIELNYETGRNGIFDDTATFDKIDPTKGYVKGNVRMISDLANRMKSSASPYQLKIFARNILEEVAGEVSRGINPEDTYQQAIDTYNWMLEQGVCPEQARIVLPVSMYTEWFWSGTLGAWSDMYKLRIDAHAQWETQWIAQQVGSILSPLFPVAWKALVGKN